MERAHVEQPSVPVPSSARRSGPTTADLLERLSQFDGTPQEFLFHLLILQCRLASATRAAMLKPEQDGQVQVLSAYPPLQKDQPTPVWLAQAVEAARPVLQTGTSTVKPLPNADQMYGQSARNHLVLVPIKRNRQIMGLGAFLLETLPPQDVETQRQKLELTTSLLSLYEMRLQLQKRQSDLTRLQDGMGVLASVNTQDRFAAAAMALVNEIASRFQADRVSLGVLKGHAIHLKAMSHTEKITRKMQIVQDIEAAMEECIDQDIEVLYPAAEATFVSRAAADLSRKHGPTAVISLPLRHGGDTVGVVTIEWPQDRGLTDEELETLRLTCDLVTARLMTLFEHDRWFGSKLAAGIRKSAGWVFGAKHTWVKLLALGILGLAAVVVFVKSDYNAEASFILQPQTTRNVTAPFDGFLTEVHVKPGDNVIEDETVLAKLDETDLRLRLLEARKELLDYQTQARAARRDGKQAERRIAQAKAEQVQARIDLLKHRLARATIVAPLTGQVIQGEMHRKINSPVKPGEPLFEIAPLDNLRAELKVPEDMISEVRLGSTGQLAAVGRPDWKIPFVVEDIYPMAEVVEGKNIFKVYVTLQQRPAWLKPGTEGLAKIYLGRKPIGWIWTRDIINWIRMKLWI